MSSRFEIECVKEAAVPDEILSAREKTWEAMKAIAAAIRPGMTEDEAVGVAKSILSEMGSPKNWHRVYLRFGRNTVKCYGDPSEPGTVLGENDIFYVDIGPVWQSSGTTLEIEGDAGDTFTTGSNAEMKRCAEDARRLFGIVKQEWSANGKTGSALYRFAAEEADKLGWRLNLKANGHRIADFPHAAYFKGNLADMDFEPKAHLWVLEILIRHPTREFGAFYEDVLF